VRFKAAVVLASLSAFQIGAANAGNFVSQGGLTWMPPLATKRTWTQAKYFCENTVINSRSGWRLPTLDELKALHESGASIDQGWETSWLWSSTKHRSDEEYYKVAFFSNYLFSAGDVMRDRPSFPSSVTCVR
jgi:Protein of unknown function (DUF1566)